MKNKTLLILLAIGAGYYFYFQKSKKKGVVIVEPLQSYTPNPEDIISQGGGELAEVSTATKIRQLPEVKKTLDTIKNAIYKKATAQLKSVEKQIVKKVQAKKAQVKKTQSKKTRAQKLGELGATYL